MAGPVKLNTFNRLSGSRAFVTTGLGTVTTVTHSEGQRAGIGSTAIIDRMDTFFLAGKKNLKDGIPGRFVLASSGGKGGDVIGGGAGGGGGGAYYCACFRDFPGHGWCVNACNACACTKTCFCAGPALHLSLCSGCRGCNSCPQSGQSHIAGGGSGGCGAPTTCTVENFTPLFSDMCVKGPGCNGSGGGVHYNPQPRPGGGGGSGACGSMKIHAQHGLGTNNPFYCNIGHGRGGTGRSPGNPGNPQPGTVVDGGMLYFESPGRANNQVNNTVVDQ